MHTVTKIIVAAGALAVVFGGVAAAAEGAKHKRHHDRATRIEHRFKKMDADKDGVVTLAEALAFADARIEKMDGNHDGVVDRAELTAHFGKHEKALHRAMAGLDKHHLDGVTKEIVEARMKKRFARFDLNGDGSVTHDELESALAKKRG